MGACNIPRVNSGVAIGEIVKVPNLITALRLCCLPVFLWLLFSRDETAQAALLLGVLGMTDWVDGWVARKLSQSTAFGAVFDPATDRILFVVGTSALLVSGAIPIWLGVAIVAREVVLSAALVIATACGMKRFPVSNLGKWYTLLLMTAVPLLLLASSDHVTAPLAKIVGWALAVPGLALCYYTAFAYVPKIRQHLVLGRAERAGLR